MTELFIEKSKLVHSIKYDYSKVEYKNNTTKIIIICQDHGEFQQTPKSHLKGAGCGKCAGTCKSNTKEFIEKSLVTHGDDVYDYSKVDYKNNKTKVLIICKIHGEFSQRPNSHLKGAGCPKCSNRNITKEEFIKRCNEKHGYEYDYTKVDYINCDTKIIIICKYHGEIQQTPYAHLNSNGCPKCSGYNLTTNEFIKKSKKVHGDKYDYSNVEYTNSYTEVSIVCKKHGKFLQKPVIHYHCKSGCPKCANKNITTEEFIEKSKLVHGDKYDYSNVDYNLSNQDVNIICKIHSNFWQTPNSHLNGSGCPKCSNRYRLTTQEFIEKSRRIHGDKYDYSKVEYKNTDTKVIIICKIHGEFSQESGSHMKGSGCKKCYHSSIGERFLQTKEEFIEKSKLVHGNKYDYSKVEYKFSNEKVIIVCKIHGDFLQKPIHHYNCGCGCPKCAGISKLTTEEFIEKSIKMHGDLYDYSQSNYINNNEKIRIICKKHGEFGQNPYNHYGAGNGCPKCCQNNYSKKQILWLNHISKYYNLNIQHAEITYEFTIPETQYRADGYCKENNTIYEFHGDFWHGNPNIYNHNDINKITNCTFKELYDKTIIKEKRIKELGYNLVVIWEYDWNKINKCVKILQQKFKKYHY